MVVAIVESGTSGSVVVVVVVVLVVLVVVGSFRRLGTSSPPIASKVESPVGTPQDSEPTASNPTPSNWVNSPTVTARRDRSGRAPFSSSARQGRASRRWACN